MEALPHAAREVLLSSTRFHGLTRVQIRARIEIDERAMHITSLIGHPAAIIDTAQRAGVDTIEELYKKAGISSSFTPDTKRVYAQAAEAAGLYGVAGAWYRAIGRGSGQYRAFLVRIAELGELRKVFGEPTADELRAIMQTLLSNEPLHNPSAALEIAITLQDTATMRRVRQWAIRLQRSNGALAERAAAALGHPLTTRERERIASPMLYRGTAVTDGSAFAYIHKHRLRWLYRPLIAVALEDWVVPFKQITKWARAFGVRITSRDLAERLQYLQRGFPTQWDEGIRIAKILARRSPRWKRRLPSIYEWARNTALGYNDAKAAERYGRRCRQPLTVAELLQVAAITNDAELLENTEWAPRRRKFCLDLAAQRIAESIGTPPDEQKVEAEVAAEAA
ncbi:MAG: hypothetical protein V1723_03720 [Candidatus Uhrbacteria bacterium]